MIEADACRRAMRAAWIQQLEPPRSHPPVLQCQSAGGRKESEMVKRPAPAKGKSRSKSPRASARSLNQAYPLAHSSATDHPPPTRSRGKGCSSTGPWGQGGQHCHLCPWHRQQAAGIRAQVPVGHRAVRRPIGDRSRMAYWVNRDYYPAPRRDLRVAATLSVDDDEVDHPSHHGPGRESEGNEQKAIASEIEALDRRSRPPAGWRGSAEPNARVGRAAGQLAGLAVEPRCCRCRNSCAG